MHTILKFYLLVSFLIFSGILYANETEGNEANHSLKLDKDGVKVYIFTRKGSKFATFKAITHINASLDSILAVMFDNKSCTEWVYSCEDSFVIEDVSFNERYHYQICDIPFPFQDRDFIFHSIMKQDLESKIVTITMSSAAQYCHGNSSEQCKKVNQSKLVRVKKTIGTYKLEPKVSGTKITWIQHTDPAGNLPSWLVNQFIKDTPYWTLKQLAEKVKEEKYKYAKLVYDNQGNAVALNTPAQKTAKDFGVYPTF
ncbi:MAG: hypothetical protein GQ546_03490 [Gammaproteobacteria bacterium]|nr:hypothetical protein [Gammaproteobacteria bacterium]